MYQSLNGKIAEKTPGAGILDVPSNGRASKEQVQFMVKRLLNLREAPALDASDALALAMCHFHSSKRETQLTENPF